MECSNLLEAALERGDISKSLRKGSQDKELIADLQKTLFELGFAKELKWHLYQADGDYGAATVSAVVAFAGRNGHSGDGHAVDNTLARLILQRHDFLPDMYVLWSIHQSDLRTRKYISKGTRTSIMAVQILLNTLGYGRLLNFEKYGADGLYGKSTRKAVIAYAKDNGISSNGDWLTRPLIDLMLQHINRYYGGDWSLLATNNLPRESSPLEWFEASRFMGKPCRADVKFVPMLKKVNAYAEQADVYVHVTSSFRTTTNVQGAIVKPATYSNHLIGHGIDMNLRHSDGQWANSKVLAKYPNVPKPVKQFLKSIIDDPDLRWGGTFRSSDPVHIDDHYNRDMAAWKQRYQIIQSAVQLGN